MCSNFYRDVILAIARQNGRQQLTENPHRQFRKLNRSASTKPTATLRIGANISLYLVISEIFIICLIISLIWGSTNPLIKHSTKEISKIKSSSKIKKLFYELKYLLFNWRYVLLFLINQSGSLLYFILLQSADLSLVVPLTNALTLIATGIFGVLLGEEKPSKRLFFGTCIISVGITLCILDKIQKRTEPPI